VKKSGESLRKLPRRGEDKLAVVNFQRFFGCRGPVDRKEKVTARKEKGRARVFGTQNHLLTKKTLATVSGSWGKLIEIGNKGGKRETLKRGTRSTWGKKKTPQKERGGRHRRSEEKGREKNFHLASRSL